MAGLFSAAAWPRLISKADNRLITVLRCAFSAERGAGIPFLHCCVSESPCPRIRTAKHRDHGLAVVDEFNTPLTRAQ